MRLPTAPAAPPYPAVGGCKHASCWKSHVSRHHREGWHLLLEECPELLDFGGGEANRPGKEGIVERMYAEDTVGKRRAILVLCQFPVQSVH